MKDIFDKLSSYNIFNYLFPGVIFVFILNWTTKYILIQDNFLIGLFVYYFIGLVISRFGSLVVEPCLRKISFLNFVDYKQFIVAANKDDKIELLSETNNMYRTISSMFIMLILFKFYKLFESKYIFLLNYRTRIIILSLTIMFLLSYKKQTKYITKRIEVNRE